ncbi:MAG: choice-of-anchor B family protein [Rubricoccaceae bacterium]|nr:choice-of-anchor B family protein [Rubricoccaceae bacterium]
MNRPIRTLCLLAVFAAASPMVNAQSLIACEGGSALNFPCSSIDLASNLTPAELGGSDGKDIWGWTDPLDGKEYVIIALDNGTAFVDISEPSSPVFLGRIETATFATTWRDVKVYSDHAFIVADGAGNHGMQVFDLTRLRNVANPPETFTPDFNFHDVTSAHNIVINEDSGYAYAVGAGACNDGFQMINIQNPTNPVSAGCAERGYTHDAQCVIYDGPDTDYLGHEICIGANGRFDNSDFVTIFDVTDKNNPIHIADVTYPNPGYAHQGWFTDDMRYWIMDDELDEGDIPLFNTRTVIFDLEDLDNPDFHAFYFGPVGSSDHNLYVRGRYAFLSNYSSGLRVLDLTDIDSGVLSEVGYFDTYPDNNDVGFSGQWSNYPYFDSGHIAMSDGVYGLFVVKTTFPIVTNSQTPELPADAAHQLSSAYPNPFSDQSRATLTVAEPQRVEINLFDIVGRKVATLFSGDVPSGTPLDVLVERGSLPAGLYIIHVQGEFFSETQRVSLVH